MRNIIIVLLLCVGAINVNAQEMGTIDEHELRQTASLLTQAGDHHVKELNCKIIAASFILVGTAVILLAPATLAASIVYLGCLITGVVYMVNSMVHRWKSGRRLREAGKQLYNISY